MRFNHALEHYECTLLFNHALEHYECTMLFNRQVVLGEGEVGVDELGLSENIEVGTSFDPGEDVALPERVKALEMRAIRDAMTREPGNVSGAARLLGITRFALMRKLEKYGEELGLDSELTEGEPSE